MKLILEIGKGLGYYLRSKSVNPSGVPAIITSATAGEAARSRGQISAEAERRPESSRPQSQRELEEGDGPGREIQI
jgi:hypothetical protein